MDINIVARHMGVTERFSKYAHEKLGKIENLGDHVLAVEVRVTRQAELKASASLDKVEITVIGKGPVIRAEADGEDKYGAFDRAFAKLSERLRRAKDRKKVHRGMHRPSSLREASHSDFRVVDITPADAAFFDQAAPERSTLSENESPAPEYDGDDYTPVVIRSKVFSEAALSVSEALDHMELVGHDFYLFVDSDTGRPSVVYRRKGWNYGVLTLEQLAQNQAHQELAPSVFASVN